MMRIKKNDTVVIITGPDKGKQGKVIDIKHDKNLVKVKGIALVTKHAKARKQGEVSAIKKIERFIDASNVMLISPVDSKPCRVNFKVLEDGKKVRTCNRTKEII
jgi:large subunit ribosomal protein L24